MCIHHSPNPVHAHTQTNTHTYIKWDIYQLEFVLLGLISYNRGISAKTTILKMSPDQRPFCKLWGFAWSSWSWGERSKESRSEMVLDHSFPESVASRYGNPVGLIVLKQTPVFHYSQWWRHLNRSGDVSEIIWGAGQMFFFCYCSFVAMRSTVIEWIQ